MQSTNCCGASSIIGTPRLMAAWLSMVSIAACAQQLPQEAWFLGGVTKPESRQSTVKGRSEPSTSGLLRPLYITGSLGDFLYPLKAIISSDSMSANWLMAAVHVDRPAA